MADMDPVRKSKIGIPEDAPIVKEYLRDPNANTALGMLEIKKIVSMAQSVIKSWLKALLILGFCSRNTAKKLPKVPRLISTELTTPETQNFHSSKCCEKTEKLFSNRLVYCQCKR